MIYDVMLNEFNKSNESSLTGDINDKKYYTRHMFPGKAIIDLGFTNKL